MEHSAPDIPQVLHVEWQDIRQALSGGWHDFRAAPLFGLAFAAIYVAAAWIMVWALTAKGQLWWILPASAGFPILGPFIACGLYEVSRRLEQGAPLTRAGVFGVILRQKDRQIPTMAAVLMIFFLFWNFLAHMLFALFLGNAPMVNISSSFQTFTSAQGLMFLTVGTGVGAVLAGLLFAVTVISLPLLMVREVDFVTAMITSFNVVRESPAVMLAWAAVIAGMMFLAMLPGFLGLLLVLPILGHASWHLYRRAVDWE